MVIALNGDKTMFYDIVGVKEKEAAQLNRSEPAGVESTSSTDSISQNRENGNTSRKKHVQLFAPRGARKKIYCAHSYNVFERGGNENANKLRRFIPKGADIKENDKGAQKIPLMTEEESAKQGVITFSNCVTF